MVNQSQLVRALESQPNHEADQVRRKQEISLHQPPPAQPPILGGHERIVKRLLDMHGGDYGRALHVASAKGLDQVVKILLDRKADVNAQCGYYGNALQVASFGGHEQVVKMLLDKGANVNAQGGYYGNALQAASYGGHEQIVKLLLDGKADVNAQGGDYANALQAASAGGHEQIVKLLLDRGADVNAQGGEDGNALQAASADGYEQIVKLLLDGKADVNAQGGDYGNALQAASYGCHEQIVKMLLNSKADVNAQGGYYGNALQAASAGGHEQIVKLLLDRGADVKAKGGDYANALQAASFGGHEKVVKVLLDNNADVNAQGGDYANALQAASLQGHEQVVKMLLDSNADVDAQGGDYGNALHAASLQGHEQVVKILLKSNADVDAQFGDYGNALDAASYGGHEQIVKLLLDSKSNHGHGQKRSASNACETETRLKKFRACVLQAPKDTYETREHIPQQAAPTTIHSAEPWEAEQTFDSAALIESHEKLIADLELKVEQQLVVLNHIMMSTSKEEVKAVFALRFCQTHCEDAEHWSQQFNVCHGTKFDRLWKQFALEEAPETFSWSSWGERMVKICQIWHFLSFPYYNHKHDQSHCKECSSPDCKPICSKAPFHVFMGMLKDHCDICHKDFVGPQAQENRQDCKNSHYGTQREIQYPNNNFQPCKTCDKLE